MRVQGITSLVCYQSRGRPRQESGGSRRQIMVHKEWTTCFRCARPPAASGAAGRLRTSPQCCMHQAASSRNVLC